MRAAAATAVPGLSPPLVSTPEGGHTGKQDRAVSEGQAHSCQVWESPGTAGRWAARGFWPLSFAFDSKTKTRTQRTQHSEGSQVLGHRIADVRTSSQLAKREKASSQRLRPPEQALWGGRKAASSPPRFPLPSRALPTPARPCGESSCRLSRASRPWGAGGAPYVSDMLLAMPFPSFLFPLPLAPPCVNTVLPGVDTHPAPKGAGQVCWNGPGAPHMTQWGWGWGWGSRWAPGGSRTWTL